MGLDTGDTGISGALTDGSGIGSFGSSKIVKDLVLDALLSIPVSLAAISIGGLEAAIIAPVAVTIAIADSLVRVVYRGLLRWAQS